MAFISTPSSPPGEDVRGEVVTIPNIHHLRETSTSVNLSNLDTYDTDAAFIASNSSESSCMSASSTHFHFDNMFLGSTSACDLLDYAMPDSDGNITETAIATAFIRSVAEEHEYRCSASPDEDTPCVTSIMEEDIDNCMAFETQRRAKLGRISLLQFLKAIEFEIRLRLMRKMLLVHGAKLLWHHASPLKRQRIALRHVRLVIFTGLTLNLDHIVVNLMCILAF